MADVRDLFHGEAELRDEEDDESFDEETGEATARTNGSKGNLEDSSEEDDDDDDEEAAAAVSACHCWLNPFQRLCLTSPH